MEPNATARRKYLPILSGRLRQLRESLGLVQQEVADLFRTSRNVPSQWETGMREPSFEHLLVLADYYGVTVDWLMGREGAEKDDPHVKEIKRELAAYLQSQEQALVHTSTGWRLDLAIQFLTERDGEKFSLNRISRQVLVSEATLRQMLADQVLPTNMVVQRFSQFSGIPEVWFYQPAPQMVDPLEKYRPLAERLHAEGLTPEAAEQRVWGVKRSGRRAGVEKRK